MAYIFPHWIAAHLLPQYLFRNIILKQYDPLSTSPVYVSSTKGAVFYRKVWSSISIWFFSHSSSIHHQGETSAYMLRHYIPFLHYSPPYSAVSIVLARFPPFPSATPHLMTRIMSILVFNTQTAETTHLAPFTLCYTFS